MTLPEKRRLIIWIKFSYEVTQFLVFRNFRLRIKWMLWYETWVHSFKANELSFDIRFTLHRIIQSNEILYWIARIFLEYFVCCRTFELFITVCIYFFLFVRYESWKILSLNKIRLHYPIIADSNGFNSGCYRGSGYSCNRPFI